MATEVKVGILFVVVALLAVVVGLFMSDVSARWGTYRVVVYFKDVKGLTPGAEVQLSGVKVGKVLSIALQPSPQFPDRLVRVELAVAKRVALFETDEFVIDQGTLLGDRMVAVRRLTHERLQEEGRQRGGELKPGQKVAGGELVGFATLAESLEETRRKVDEAIVSLQATYAGPQMQQDLRELLDNVKQASAQGRVLVAASVQLVGRLDRTVQQSQGAVRRTVDNVEAATAGLRRSVEQIDSFLTALSSGPLPGQLVLAVSNVRKASEEIMLSAESLREMIADPQNQQRVEQTLAAVEATAQHLERIGAGIEQVAADPQVQENIKVTLANLRETTQNLKEVSEASRELMTSRENLEAITATLSNLQEASGESVVVMQRAGQTLERVDRTMDDLADVAAQVQPRQVTGYLSLDQTLYSAMRADANLDMVWGSDPALFWRAGVRGLGRKETLNLQRGFPLGPGLGARLGVFDNQLGGALDWRATPRLRWELELWNLEEHHLDLRGVYELSPEWQMRFGMGSLGDRNDPFVGLQRTLRLRSPR